MSHIRQGHKHLLCDVSVVIENESIMLVPCWHWLVETAHLL